MNLHTYVVFAMVLALTSCSLVPTAQESSVIVTRSRNTQIHILRLKDYGPTWRITITPLEADRSTFASIYVKNISKENIFIGDSAYRATGPGPLKPDHSILFYSGPINRFPNGDFQLNKGVSEGKIEVCLKIEATKDVGTITVKAQNQRIHHD